MKATIAPQILVVDDDQTFSRTLCRLLTDNGYEAVGLSSSRALDEYLASRPVDLLLLDLSLPGTPWRTILESLRNDPAHADLPVLALTDDLPEERSVEALGLGASDVISKPVRVRELLARIRTHLRASQVLNQARAEARSQAVLVALLQEITGNLPQRDLFQVLVRQVAAGLRIPRCSILFGKSGAERVTVAAASENPMLRDLIVPLSRYPEIRKALDTGEVVLVQDATSHPLYQTVAGGQTTSSLVLPFSLRGERAGVFFLRTGPGDPPLGDADLRFAERVVESAATAIEHAQDQEDSRHRETALRQQAESDPLTGLCNRHALEHRVRREVEHASRNGTVLTGVRIDIDPLTEAGDRFDQSAGDQILVQFAELLRREQRAVDTVARFGEQAFVVLLPETGNAGARLFAERILRSASEGSFGSAEAPIQVTVSIGLATFPDQRAVDGEGLLRLAERNVLRAKAEGRNRYRD
jgi:two-component system cell cycle response regulator